MNLIKFNTLYNQIILENNTKIIQYNTFNYKFITDKQENKIFCIFDSVDKTDNKLIKIKVTIFENNSFEFEVNKNSKNKTYTDKEFLLAYYKEYQDFKKAFSMYKKDKLENTQEKPQEKNIIDGKSLPEIKNFNDIIAQINNISDRHFN